MAWNTGNKIKRSRIRLSSRVPVVAGLTVMVMFAVVLLVGCGGESETVRSVGKDVPARLTTVERGVVPRQITATGSLEAEKTIMVSTRMMGWLRKLHVVEGQRVTAGDLLVNIDDTDLLAKKAQAEAGIAEAEAVLTNAQKMTDRFEKLFAEKSVSRQQLDDVKTGRDRAAAGVNMARAALAEVNVHLSYLEIVAPADGVVARIMVEEGNMANPGMPLLMLEQSDRMLVVASIGEKDVSYVSAGDVVEVDITSLDNARFSVALERVIPAANPGSRTYDIEALIDNTDGRLRSGMFARIQVPIGEREAVLVPVEAIIERGQLKGLWITDAQNIAHLRWIRMGARFGDRVEVLSGLTGGERVVLDSDLPLVEGDKVVN